MEVILVISVLSLSFLVWKIIEVSDGISHINARLNNIDTVLAAYYKMLKELQPKAPVEIPARLDKETLKEVVPQLYTSRPAWMDEDLNIYKVIKRKYDPAKSTILHEVLELDEDEVVPPNEDLSKAAIEYRKNRLEDDAEKEYLGVLKSGMFWEWYPELTGVWNKDKLKWLKIYYDLTLFRAKYKEEQEYAALEGTGLEYITDEQRVELLKEVKERKKISLNK